MIFTEEQIINLRKNITNLFGEESIAVQLQMILHSHESLRGKLDIAVKALEEIKETFEIDWSEAQHIATIALAQIQVGLKAGKK